MEWTSTENQIGLQNHVLIGSFLADVYAENRKLVEFHIGSTWLQHPCCLSRKVWQAFDCPNEDVSISELCILAITLAPFRGCLG